MNKERVISREYKLVLKSEKFSGSETELISNAQAFWSALEKILTPFIQNTTGTLDSIERKREIKFYDTTDFLLRKSDYIFRERKYLDDESREFTLKFRHPDRYVSQDRNMEASVNAKTKSKFEEDIKSSFSKLYSYSTTQRVMDDTHVRKLKHILRLYPGLTRQIDKKLKDEKISLVHDLEIQEMVIAGASIHFGNNPSVEAECALIIWYEPKKSLTEPIMAEFSFRYGDKKEAYSRKAAKTAYDVYMTIQEHMKDWISENDLTKTGFVYENR